MRQRDPVAYDLASSPGVQVGMAATVLGYALVTGGIQAYSGILSGNTTDIAIGGAQMIAGAFVRLPKANMFSTTSAAKTGGEAWKCSNKKSNRQYSNNSRR